MKTKVRLDIECACKTCNQVFVLIDMYNRIPENGGYDLSKMKCVSCEQQTLEFDLLKVAVPVNAL